MTDSWRSLLDLAGAPYESEPRSVTSQVLLAPGASTDWPSNPRRIFLGISNIGDPVSGATSDFLVKPLPDWNNNEGLAAGNGALLRTGGFLQFDKNWPWWGIVRISNVGSASVYVEIMETYHGAR